VAATLVLYLLLILREVEKRIFRWRAAQWLTFSVVVLFVVISISMMVNRLLNAESIDPRSYFRIDVWESSFKMVEAQPLMGFGPGTFADVYPFFRPTQFWNTYNPFAHNEYLQVAAENGLPALILSLLLLWVFLREFTGSLFRVAAFKEAPLSLRADEIVFYLILVEAVHNSVDFTLHEWSHRLILLGFITFAFRERKKEDDWKAVFHFSRRAFFSGAAVLAFIVIWALGVGALRDFLASVYNFKGIVFQQKGNLENAEVFARKSLGFRANLSKSWDLLGGIEDRLAEISNNSVEREKHFRLADDYFEMAIQCSPYWLDPKENRIQTLVKRGRFSQGLDMENQLIEKGPEVPKSYWDKGLILIKMGRASEAIGPAQMLIDKYPYLLEGYFLKARALETLGRLKEAFKVYKDAQDMLNQNHWEDPRGQVRFNIARLKGKT
jgi:tetratricopeptide (TPR) repeat protein